MLRKSTTPNSEFLFFDTYIDLPIYTGPSNKENDHPKASTNDEMATDREKVELDTRHTLQQSFEMELKEASVTDEIQHSTTPTLVETSRNLSEQGHFKLLSKGNNNTLGRNFLLIDCSNSES
ncbi:hypothetical protein LOK49_LG07G02080 [Camellia lanceoleosa]|uniref:Uncharacterized protein n=1 Tax=Camellia lanceoleosa TaxID=1840588 RepID=A0ACC0H5C5_9ERIC|nr:hypothetical protein LOK49_LG07G02080 [Camellia lanceoleosa]